MSCIIKLNFKVYYILFIHGDRFLKCYCKLNKSKSLECFGRVTKIKIFKKKKNQF